MKPMVLPTIAEFRAWRKRQPASAPVAFVPTMGALHEGHASLVRQARQAAGPSGQVVVSIFVNPTQFGPQEDFAKYPRTLAADLRLIEEAGGSAVYAPAPAEMYPEGGGVITVDPGPMASVLEGAIRPGHFRGVCTVVAKLLHIVAPTHLLMGQKDYQQQAILRQMVRDLDMEVTFITCPTIREPDGLAMSSRNRYLDPDQRQRAVAISQALVWAKSTYDAGQRNAPTLNAGMKQRIEARGLTVDYALACHAQSLAPWEGDIAGPCVLLIAARIGTTRLIDNMVV